MGDRLHKNSPPPEKLEDVTELFVAQVKAKLAANAAHNIRFALKNTDPDFRICSHAQLADATGIDPNIIKHMFGGVRPGTKTKKITRSRFVGLIRHALEISQVTVVPFVMERANIARTLAGMNDDQWKRFAPELTKLIDEAKKDGGDSGKR